MALHMPHRAPVAAAEAPVRPPPAWSAVGWLAGGALLTFAVAWLGTTVLELHHDVYYLVYFTFALGYLGWFAERSGLALREVLRRNLWWSLAVGALVGLAVVRQVLGQPGTPHPDGAFFAFELVWRGLVYGAVDALVLAVLPALVAHLVLHGDRRGLARKAAFGGLVVVLSLGISASYHLGYATYRSSEISKPLIGTVMWDLPAVLTGNPAGALLAHPAAHTAAAVHQYYGGEETNQLLPPQLGAGYADQPGGTAAAAVAVGWLVLLGGAVGLGRRRLAVR